MKCPLCSVNMKIELRMTGGCCGHFSEDDRCYCDSPDCHVEIRCPNNLLHVWSESKHKYVKNPNYCKQSVIKPGNLSDQGAISRWIEEHYTPQVTTVQHKANCKCAACDDEHFDGTI